MPCPSELRFLVELENPIARATRSEEIVRHLSAVSGERVVDIGCGPGRVAMRLAEAVGVAGEVIVVDVQAEMLDVVRTKAEEGGVTNIRYLLADLSQPRVWVEKVDAAVLVMMLGEVPDREALLEFVQKCLKEEGRLLVAESVFDPHYTRRAKLVSMTRRAGFDQVSVRGNWFGYSMVFKKHKAANQALQTTSVTRSEFGKVSEFDRFQRGV